ncbi:MAG: LmeA family phospholipid-binding protein [Candidatus Rokuibacteriota bacterium]
MSRAWTRSLAEWVLVGAVFAALVAVAAVWLALDRRPPEWDHANHLERAVACAEDLARADLRAVLERSSFYPPLVLCAAGLAYRLAPSDVIAAQAVVLAFLGLGMAVVYALGRRFAGGAEGVVAALVFGSAPFVVFSSLRFQLDLPLASMVALTVFLLLRTDGFERRDWSVAVGVALALGMLTKPPFAAYVLVPLVLVATRIRSRRALGSFALALLLGGALVLPWYGPRLYGFVPDIGSRAFRQAAESGHPDPFSASGLLFYPKLFVPQLGVVAVLLFAIGLVVALRRRRWLLLATALAPLLLFLLIQNKNLRYTLPLLPFAAVLAGMGFGALRGRVRSLALTALVVGAVAQVGATAFAVPPSFTLPGLGVPLLHESPPMRVDWRHREVLALLGRESRGAAATVSVVPNDNFFSASNFRYYAVRDGLPLRWTRAWDGEPVGIEYMILKTGAQGPAWTVEKPRRIAERLAADPHLARVFPVIGEFALPDGSTATVRARRILGDVAVSPARLGRALEDAVRRRLAEVARDVEGFEVRVVHDDGILAGRVRRIEVRAAAATVGDLGRRNAALLRVHNVAVVFHDVLMNPWSLAAEGRLDPLDAGRVRLERATIGGADLAAFLRDLKGFRQASVALEDGAIAFAVRQPGPDVSARVRFVPAADRPFALAFERVRVGGVPVPGLLADWVVRGYDPSLRMASRLPVRVEIGRVKVAPDTIRISSDP